MTKTLFAALLVLGCALPLAAQTTVSGSKGNNVSAPSTTKNVPVLPAIACSSAQAYTAGRVVFPCVSLFGPMWVEVRDSSGNAVTFIGDPVSATATALSECVLISAASTNATNCKASAGNFYGVQMINTTATLYYLRLYNLGSAPTCSSATGFIRTIPIPASTTGAGVVITLPYPIAYGTGIGFCFTGGSSSTDNTNAATGVFGVALYK